MILSILRKIVPLFLIDWYHFLLPAIGAFLYGFPSRKLTVIGVTGTNGKSTVVEMIARILTEVGHKVTSLSSIRFQIGEKNWQNKLKMTMPGRLELQKFLKEALDAGCQYAVLEVTSEGIMQHRHRFIDFNVAVFTNLTPEHIEAHGSFENYCQAKGKLFKATKGTHIINLDDENKDYFLGFPAKEKYGYTIENPKSEIKKIIGKDPKIIESGLEFFVNETRFNLGLLGKFNIYNALTAICVSLSQDIDLKICKRALEKIKNIPGRMELVIEDPFRVFVDYAFTPNALEKVYQTLKATRGKQQETRMICVLGAAGGGRDKWKRPVLGEIAGKFCDEVIITNEDPYDEDPMAIIEQVAKGTKGKAKKMLDRREAIKKALKIARTDDIIIITGKGCEPWICVAGGKKIPWDDREVAKEEFSKLKT
jgi:UDP-N-acetylmuramoyl-L-alanyl-D-glutamate--2,6-diaminopimelate ligase